MLGPSSGKLATAPPPQIRSCGETPRVGQGRGTHLILDPLLSAELVTLIIPDSV